MRAFLIVLDGLGVGTQADADRGGGAARNTLLHLAETAGGLRLPTLERLGLGRIVALPGARSRLPAGAFGRMESRSPGQDCLVGHRELAGCVLDRPLPVYAGGLPILPLDRMAGRLRRGWIGDAALSGPEALTRFGAEHRESGSLVVWASRTSSIHIAAHHETVPPAELEEVGRIAREAFVGEHAVGRVLVRSFQGGPGAFRWGGPPRAFALPPPAPTLLDRLAARAVPVFAIGGVDDLFAGRGISDPLRTVSAEESLEALRDVARIARRGLVFADLLRQDCDAPPPGPRALAGALEQVDASLAELLDRLRSDDLMMITADHGQDPAAAGDAHAQERVPLLVAGPRVRAGVDLGTRETLADAGASLADCFGVGRLSAGRSFLREIRA